MKFLNSLVVTGLLLLSATAHAESYKAPNLDWKPAKTAKPKVQKESWEKAGEYKLEEDPAKARDVASEEDEEKQSHDPDN